MSLHYLVADATHRGLGHASKAVDALVRAATEQAITVHLQAIQVDFEDGCLGDIELRSFYERKGFVWLEKSFKAMRLAPHGMSAQQENFRDVA